MTHRNHKKSCNTQNKSKFIVILITLFASQCTKKKKPQKTPQKNQQQNNHHLCLLWFIPMFCREVVFMFPFFKSRALQHDFCCYPWFLCYNSFCGLKQLYYSVLYTHILSISSSSAQVKIWTQISDLWCLPTSHVTTWFTGRQSIVTSGTSKSSLHASTSLKHVSIDHASFR